MLEAHKTWQEKLKKGKGVLAIMLVVAISLTSCVSTHSPCTPNPLSITYKNVTAAEAQQLIRENSNLIILDVRTQSKYDSGHIPNAALIPVEELADRLGELDETKLILVYCQSGGRSAQASQVLVDNGYSQVYNLEGGIIAWQEAGAAVNHLPIIESLTASEDQVAPGSSCRIKCIASDPDEDELSYEWSTDGGRISGDDSTITWNTPDAVGTYNITVVVTDGQGGESRGSLTVNVVVNHPPIIKDLIITSEDPKDFDLRRLKVYKGARCDIECDALDPDGDELSYEWSAEGDWTDGGEIFGHGFVITWTAPPTIDPNVTITVAVSDGRGGTDTESIVFEVVGCRCRL